MVIYAVVNDEYQGWEDAYFTTSRQHAAREAKKLVDEFLDPEVEDIQAMKNYIDDWADFGGNEDCHEDCIFTIRTFQVDD